jgi:hypothetical protein
LVGVIAQELLYASRQRCVSFLDAGSTIPDTLKVATTKEQGHGGYGILFGCQH